MDKRYGLPGSKYVRNDLARLLSRQNANNGSTAGGLAHVLQQGLMGYMYGQDRKAALKDASDQSTAQAAMAQGMAAQPWVNPDTGQTSNAPAGGYQGALSALSGMPDNPYAGRLASQLAMKQFEMQEADKQRRAALQDSMALKAAPGWAAPKDPVPGRDVPYSQDVQEQKLAIAGAEAAARVQPPPGYQREGEGMAPIPGGPQDPNVIAEQKKSEAQAKASVEREAAFPKVKAGLADFRRKVATVTGTIDKALDLAAPINPETGKREPSGWSTGYGAYLDVLPNTDAGALQGYLTTVKANLGFDTLQKMRESSPTGGALGSVSENENTLLQAVNGALDPKQAAQLVDNLSIIRELYPQVLAEKEAAFQADYGDLMGDGAAVPVGVDPKVWEYMTPEEKALFK